METHNKKHRQRWLFWALAVFFYFYEYFLRVSPTVMVPEIMQAFKVQAISIGTLSAAYLYAYAFMQLPVGMMMDRFGARKLLSIAALICALGCASFGFSEFFGLLIIGRILLGIGSAFAFLGMVYICSHWFEKHKIATLIAIGNSFGMIGAIGGEGPLAMSVVRFGWRLPIIFLGVVGLITAIVMAIFLRSDKDCHIEAKEGQMRQNVNVLQNLKSVAKNPQSWLVGLGTFLIYSTTAGFAALWGVPFLQSAYGMTKDGASYAVSIIFVGWIVGGPLIGKLSDMFKHRRLILIVCSIIGAFLISWVIYIPNLSRPLLYILMFAIGFFSSSENLCYPLAIEHNEKKAKGVASAFVNCILFLGVACIPIIVGSFLDSNWSGATQNGVPIYSVGEFKIALATFPITFILAAIVFLFVKRSPISIKMAEEYVD